MCFEKWFIAGPPLSGKSTVGVLLSQLLGCPFEDLDVYMENHSGMSVETIFRRSGESGFRRLESLCLVEIAGRQGPLVVSLGGGTLLLPENLAVVTSKGVLFTLHAPERELLTRVSEGRPLARNPGELRRLLRTRRDHYQRLPGRIDTRGLTPGETARLIANRIDALRRPR